MILLNKKITYTTNVGNSPRVDDGRTTERKGEEIVSDQSEGLLTVLTGLGDVHHCSSSESEATLNDKHRGLDLESSSGVGPSEN
jgi:hypothetical protein